MKIKSKWILIGISGVFLFFMLVLPLISVITNSLKEGIGFYFQSLATPTVKSAFGVTVLAAVIAVVVNTIFGIAAAWLITRFSFKGKQILSAVIDIPFSISPVIAGLAFLMTFGRMGWAGGLIARLNEALGTNIQIVFAVPGVVLATVFVTFPFVSREIIPVLLSVGKEEEEAAALMGADGFTIFRKITFPHIRWALLYGIILCTARALGEFGAVHALSKNQRGDIYPSSGNRCPLSFQFIGVHYFGICCFIHSGSYGSSSADHTKYSRASGKKE